MSDFESIFDMFDIDDPELDSEPDHSDEIKAILALLQGDPWATESARECLANAPF